MGDTGYIVLHGLFPHYDGEGVRQVALQGEVIDLTPEAAARGLELEAIAVHTPDASDTSQDGADEATEGTSDEVWVAPDVATGEAAQPETIDDPAGDGEASGVPAPAGEAAPVNASGGRSRGSKRA